MTGHRLTRAIFPLLVCGAWFVSACGGRGRQWSAPQSAILEEDVYAQFGHPDQLEAFPNGPAPRPIDEGEPDGFPYEIWHYHDVPGIGDNVELTFVDTCMCGRYRLAENDPMIVDLITKGSEPR
jgi:hypothetical protein